MEVVVKARQTLSDIAVQVYGDLRAAPLIAISNRISLTDAIAPGTKLKCPEVVFDRYLQNYVRRQGISPATSENI